MGRCQIDLVARLHASEVRSLAERLDENHLIAAARAFHTRQVLARKPRIAFVGVILDSMANPSQPLSGLELAGQHPGTVGRMNARGDEDERNCH